MTGSFFGSTLFLFPQTLNRYPASTGQESPQTQHTQDTGSPTRGTPVPTWPRQVSPSATLGTSPLPRRPPCSSAWSSPPSTCPAVQVIVLSFFLGHLGKGRAGLRGRGGFLGPGWPCTVERKNKFPWRIRQGTPVGVSWGVLGLSVTLNSLARTAAVTWWSLRQRKKIAGLSVSRFPWGQTGRTCVAPRYFPGLLEALSRMHPRLPLGQADVPSNPDFLCSTQKLENYP